MIVNIDFQKAFDSIGWPYMDCTLDFFNFGTNFLSWVCTLYKDSFSKVINNGWTSEPFCLTRGLTQGYPLPSFLFILVAEILANKICINQSIKGITINKVEHKVCQYADDTEIIILYDEQSSRERFCVYDSFDSISGSQH